jgi:phosphonate transport system substrate-binding protein
MPPLYPLKAVSYLAPNWFWFYASVTAYLQRILPIEIELTQADHDPLDDPLLLDDRLDLAFICGLPFIRHHPIAPSQLQAIAAPVMMAPRYLGQPIYFADVIVNAASDLRHFDELANKSVGYNDLGSNSGYNLLRWQLLNSGQPPELTQFFSVAIPSGSHQRSIQWIANGIVDCAAIDSTVLEQAQQADPTLAQQVRVLCTIGPAPMPPIAVAQHLGIEMIQAIQAYLLNPDSILQSAMTQAGVKHYSRVRSQDYQILAEIYEAIAASKTSQTILGVAECKHDFYG